MVNPNSKCYFTLTDKISQDNMLFIDENDKVERVRRNLKVAFLLNEQVVIRATSIINSNISAKILGEFKDIPLINAIVPEVRKEDKPIKTLAEQSKGEDVFDKDILFQKIELAECLDCLGTKEQVEAEKLSEERSFLLLYQIFRLFIEKSTYLTKNMSLELLQELAFLLFRGIPDRTAFIYGIEKIFIQPEYAHHLIQSIYFGIGAKHTQANPVWTNEINPLNQFSIWNLPQIEFDSLDDSQEDFAKRNGIWSFIHNNKQDLERVNALQLKDISVTPEEIISCLDIVELQIDHLTWLDVEYLRKSPEFKKIIRYTIENKFEKNYNIDYIRFLEEKKRFQFREKLFDFTVNVFGLIPGLGTIMNLAIMGKDLWLGKEINQALAHNLPLISFSEIVKTTAHKSFEKSR